MAERGVLLQEKTWLKIVLKKENTCSKLYPSVTRSLGKSIWFLKADFILLIPFGFFIWTRELFGLAVEAVSLVFPSVAYV